MHYLNNIQNNIGSFFLLSDGLYCFFENSKLTKYDLSEYTPCWSVYTDTQYTLLGNNDKYLISFWQYKKIINIVQGQIVNENNISFIPTDLKQDGSLEGIFYYDNLFYYGYLSKDLKKSNIIFSTSNRKPQLITNNIIVCFGDTLNTIVCFEIGKNAPIWEKDFSENIEGYILTYKDNLLVSMSNNDLICLKQGTGQEVWRCKNVFGSRTTRIIERNRLYVLSNSIYFVVDIDNGKMIENIDLSEGNKTNKILSPAGYIKTGNQILFINIGFSSYLPAVGSFNIITKNYDWIHRFEGLKNSYGGFSGTNCLQYHDGKLYVLTSDGILHIFEEGENGR